MSGYAKVLQLGGPMATRQRQRTEAEPRGWRWFAAEFVVVAAGVLAALVAQQVVQNLEWRERVEAAETDLRAELQQNARNAFYRLATAGCATSQIAERRAVLKENRDRGRAVPAQPKYVRSTQSWLADNWEATRSLQLTGHMRTERLQQFATAYTLVGLFREQQRLEQELKPAVDTLTDNAGVLSQRERDRLFLALGQLEEQSNRLDLIAFRYLEAAQPLGVSVPVDLRATTLKRAQAFIERNGAAAECVRDPTPWLSHGDQAVQWLMTRDGQP